MAIKNNWIRKKEYNYMAKGIVTRDVDPKEKKRVQVYIPAYHGKKDESKIGSGSDLGKYPWAQACVPVMSTEGGNSSTKGFWSSFFSGLAKDGSQKKNAAIPPKVGDIVWLTFEGGDVSRPIVTGVLYACADESDVASSDSLSGLLMGGGLAKLVAEIMSANEGSYTTVNWNDNGATSIGKAQWHANRARNLLMQIRDKNSASFIMMCPTLNAICNEGTSWNTMILSAGSSNGIQLKAVLATNESKEVQDNLILQDCQAYIEHGQALGLSDPAALIYYSDVENQYGQGGAHDLGKNGGNDLDSIHNYAMSHKYGQYANRRNTTYNKIKEMKNSGALNAVTACDISGTNLGGQLLWPVPDCKVVTSKYGYRTHPVSGKSNSFHSGVDLSGGGAMGKPIYASHAGTIATQTTSGGYGVLTKVTNGNITTYYAHQCRRADGITDGVTVAAGQLIGYVGTTGCSTGPHLHFEVRINGQTQDPIPYIQGPGVQRA